MKVLLVHPEDQPQRWASQKWDLIVDLSWAPANTYAQWAREFQCPAVPFQQYCRLSEDLDFIRYISDKGTSLADEEGIRWWELFVLFFNDQMQLIASVCRLAESLSCNDEVFITRPCVEAEMLQRLRMFPVHLLSGPSLRRRFCITPAKFGRCHFGSCGKFSGTSTMGDLPSAATSQERRTGRRGT